MVDLQGVFVRTTAGLEEIRTRAHGLTPVQRNLLILLDGKSALASFAPALGCAVERMPELAETLFRGGLIAAAGPQPAAAALTGETVSAHALGRLAEAVFGTHAGPIVRKLEKAGGSKAELLAAAEGAAKLAKLTIDETKAREFLAEVRKLISG